MTTLNDSSQNDWFEKQSRGRKARPSSAKKLTNVNKKPSKNGVRKPLISSSNKSKKSYQRPLADMLRTAKKMPQAILKITSYAKDKGRIQSYLTYISRHAKLNLEDEKEQLIQSKREQEELIAEWGTRFSDRKNSRHAAHLMLSTPEGTLPEKARQAAKDFLAERFGQKHVRYVFVMHEDTKHPHIHVALNMSPTQGKKLNLNPKDLYDLRANFAEACRNQGIQVDASLRWERGLAGKAEKSQLVRMKREGRIPDIDQKLLTNVKEEVKQPLPSKHPSEEKSRKRNQLIRRYYIDKAKELQQKKTEIADLSDKVRVEAAAQLLNQFAKDLPVEKTRGDKIKIALEKAEHRQEMSHFHYKSKTEKRFERLAEKDYQDYAKGLFLEKETDLEKRKNKEPATDKEYLNLYLAYQEYQEREKEKGAGLEKQINRKE